MKKSILTGAFLGFVFPSFVWANACSQTSNTLDGLVGLDNSNGTVYAAFKSVNNECSCTSARFKPENTDVKAALSVLLAAKMSDKKVRIDFLNSTDCSTAYRVYVQ